MTLYREGSQAFVEPSAVFSVLDHCSRQKTNQSRVQGTIMGRYSIEEDKFFITGAYPVPHRESPVAVDFKTHSTLSEMHQVIYPKDYVLGWYSTGELGQHSITVHGFYSKTSPNPQNVLHLLVDGSCSSFKVYSAVDVGSSDNLAGKYFMEIKSSLILEGSTRTAMNILQRNVSNQPTVFKNMSEEESVNQTRAAINEMMSRLSQPDAGEEAHKDFEKLKNLLSKRETECQKSNSNMAEYLLKLTAKLVQ